MGKHFSYKSVRYTIGGEVILLDIPDAAEVQSAYATGAISERPYWTRIWPSSLAMAEYLAANPVMMEGKEVWECGAGLALPSLVAARWAKLVLCSDLYEAATDLMNHNAALNKLRNVVAGRLDWNALPAKISADIVLLSDVHYEPDQFEHVYKMITRFLDAGCTVLLGSPSRVTSAPFLQRLGGFITTSHQVRVDETDVLLLVLRYC